MEQAVEDGLRAQAEGLCLKWAKGQPQLAPASGSNRYPLPPVARRLLSSAQAPFGDEQERARPACQRGRGRELHGWAGANDRRWAQWKYS